MLGRGSDIGVLDDGLGPELLHGIQSSGCGGIGEVGEHQVRAISREFQCSGAADATCGARDDRDTIGKGFREVHGRS